MSRLLWFGVFLVLLAGLFYSASLMSPTGSAVLNQPPIWDYPTTNFITHNTVFKFDLSNAFFDPDGDPLTFRANGAGMFGSMLVVTTHSSREIWVEASDGHTTTLKRLFIEVK